MRKRERERERGRESVRERERKNGRDRGEIGGKNPIAESKIARRQRGKKQIIK